VSRVAPALGKARAWLVAYGLGPPPHRAADLGEIAKLRRLGPEAVRAALEEIDRKERALVARYDTAADTSRCTAQKARDLIAALIAEGACR